jgi:DNA-binding NarL/FixJ family response regulator
MARTSCLAGIDPALVPMFTAVFKAAGVSKLATVARLDVTELGKAAPSLLVCDVDDCDVDCLELLRRVRFVLPTCVIVVYTGIMERSWALSCHLAGANCLISKEADQRELVAGIRGVLQSGCYTDPRFAA